MSQHRWGGGLPQTHPAALRSGMRMGFETPEQRHPLYTPTRGGRGRKFYSSFNLSNAIFAGDVYNFRYGKNLCISDPALKIKINGLGVVVEESPFLGQLLPRVIVKHESAIKGTGVCAGRRIGPRELVLIYLGEFVTVAEARPLTRMIVKQTWGEYWAYCFGTESLQTCLDVGAALGSYANSPGPGEVVNCVLNRKAAFKCKDDKGKERMGYPMFSNKVIEEGKPILWPYNHTAGCGTNFA
jgi:hypothetical protein